MITWLSSIYRLVATCWLLCIMWCNQTKSLHQSAPGCENGQAFAGQDAARMICMNVPQCPVHTKDHMYQAFGAVLVDPVSPTASM